MFNLHGFLQQYLPIHSTYYIPVDYSLYCRIVFPSYFPAIEMIKSGFFTMAISKNILDDVCAVIDTLRKLYLTIAKRTNVL